MAKQRPKSYRDTDKFFKLQKKARARYVYFIVHEDGSYWWQLVGPDDKVVGSSPAFETRADCLKSLRTMQRHASTTQVRD